LPTPAEKRRAGELLSRLKQLYPDPECALHHENAWQLLCATILSAQCTDARVNMVTPELFRRFPTAEAMAAASQEEVEEVIKSTGFFRQKAQSLISMSQDVVTKFGGEVPGTLEELTTLRGVGRKTANVLIGVMYGGDAVVVDTHVKRLSSLLGWTKEQDPDKIEQELMTLHPRNEWTPLAHRLILHGRSTCVANRPKCPECPLNDLCPFGIRRLKELSAKPLKT
jgi:endonuclease III